MKIAMSQNHTDGGLRSGQVRTRQQEKAKLDICQRIGEAYDMMNWHLHGRNWVSRWQQYDRVNREHHYRREQIMTNGVDPGLL